MQSRIMLKNILYAIALTVAFFLSFALYIIIGADGKPGVHTLRPVGLVSVLLAASWVTVSVLNQWRKRP